MTPATQHRIDQLHQKRNALQNELAATEDELATLEGEHRRLWQQLGEVCAAVEPEIPGLVPRKRKPRQPDPQNRRG